MIDGQVGNCLTGSSMAKCQKFWMNSEAGYGFQNVPKVIAFDLNTFLFV